MAQWVRYFLHKLEDQSLDPQHLHKCQQTWCLPVVPVLMETETGTELVSYMIQITNLSIQERYPTSMFIMDKGRRKSKEESGYQVLASMHKNMHAH